MVKTMVRWLLRILSRAASAVRAWVLRLFGKRAPGKPAPGAPPPAPPPMHFSPPPDHLPLCGASSRGRWTVEVDHATCPECVSRGRMLQLVYDVGTR